jgi:hypothetical protein
LDSACRIPKAAIVDFRQRMAEMRVNAGITHLLSVLFFLKTGVVFLENDGLVCHLVTARNAPLDV